MKEKKSILEYIKDIDQPNQDGCLRFYNEYKERITSAAGSFIKHQAWEGGYVDHIEETMSIAEAIYEPLQSLHPVSFSLSDVYLSLFWHDAEKIFKYTEPKMSFKSEKEKISFIFELMREYGIDITEDIKNAIIYVHGEGEMYSPFENVQRPLAAFIHCCDTISARIWSDHPRQR